MQAVFLTGNPRSVGVTNAAVAVNTSCSHCTTYAYAYQYVVSTPRTFRLSSDGRQQIKDIGEPATNVAAPVNVAAALNVLSDGSTATANATQTSYITQQN